MDHDCSLITRDINLIGIFFSSVLKRKMCPSVCMSVIGLVVGRLMSVKENYLF